MKKILLIDIIIIGVWTVLSLLIAVITDILLTDLFFWGFVANLTVSAILLGLARHEMRRAAKKTDMKVKETHRKTFRLNEKLAFNFFFVSAIFFVISTILVTT